MQCPAFAVPGGALTGVRLTYTADYQFGLSPANTVEVTFAPAGPPAVLWDATVKLSASGGLSPGQVPTGGANAIAGVSAAAFGSPFIVNVSSMVTAGGVATSSGAVSVAYTYTPAAPMTLTCPANSATLATPYSSALVATGASGPHAFSIQSGSLPGGLSLDSNTGAIAGNPAAMGPFTFTASVWYISGPPGTVTVECTIVVQPGDALRPGTVIGEIDVIAKKKPGSKAAFQQTDSNGLSRFTLEAGTYQLLIRQPSGPRIEGIVRAIGTAKAVDQIKVKGAPVTAPAKAPIAAGRMVLNPDTDRSQLAAFGAGSPGKDIILDEEITLNAPATLDLQLTRGGDPAPATGLTFVAAQGSLKTMPQSIPIEPTETAPRTVAVRKLPAPVDFIEVLNPLTVLQPGQPMPPIQIAAIARGLKAGLYSAPLTIAITGDVTLTRTLTVNLLVVGARTALPAAVGARSLIFTAPVGGSAPAQSLRLWNANGAEGTSAAFTVGFVNASDAQYLSITPNQRTILSGGSADVSVQPLPAAFGNAGVRTVALAVSSRDAVTQTVEVKIVAVPANCRASQLIPAVMEAPPASVGGLQSAMTVAVVDDCGSFSYNTNIVAQDGTYTIALKYSTTKSNVRTHSIGIPYNPPEKTKENKIMLTVWGDDPLGNQLTGSTGVDATMLPAAGGPLIRNIGGLAQSGNYSATDRLNTVEPTGFAAGQSITITGSDLPAKKDAASNKAALGTTLGGVQLELNGQPIPLIAVSKDQIDAVLPYGSEGLGQLVLVNVKTGERTALPPIFIGPAAPALLRTGKDFVILKVTGNTTETVTQRKPAVPGDKIQFSATGLGAVLPPVPAGALIAANDTSRVVNGPVTLKIGGVVAQVTSARLAPGNQGEYLVEAIVPAGPQTPAGGAAPLPLELSVGGARSEALLADSFQTQLMSLVFMKFATAPVSGLTLTVNNTQYSSTANPPPFPSGAPVTVSIPNPQFLGSNTETRYVLQDNLNNPAVFTYAASNTQIVYDFVPYYKLTLNQPASGSIRASATIQGVEYYRENVPVAVLGQCGPNLNFVKFIVQRQGAAPFDVTTNPFLMTMTAPTSVFIVCAPPEWNFTESLNTGRYSHAAALLPSGKVLVAGGYGPGGVSDRPGVVEIYNPANATWTQSSLGTQHAFNAVRLLTGEILLVGDEPTASVPAHLYNEATSSVISAGLTKVRRYSAPAALLPSGDVLYAGGYVGGCCNGDAGNYETAEIYNRASNTWTATASMSTKRAGFTLTVLPSGKVLAAGGWYRDTETMRNSAEIFDPVTKTWSPAAPMFFARGNHTATLLPNGKVLVVGGYSSSFSTYTPSAEIYDPATNQWMTVGSLGAPRALHTATLLPDGKVLVAGGSNGTPLVTSEIYDPATSQWSGGPNLKSARARFTATLLPNGQVLAVGGQTASGVTATSELYK